MALPIDLLYLRHAQSEGNVARRRSEEGDHSAFNEKFQARHSGSYRLSKLGQEQATKAGIWIRKEFCPDGKGFDRHITSEYLRAMETAALLDLPRARWYADFNLRERFLGELEALSDEERSLRFEHEMTRRNNEPFFWTPPNGESLAQQALRVGRSIGTLHRECGEMRVIKVCHGETMWTARVMLERMTQVRFRELYLSKQPEDRIYNCQIIHYTRRNPETGELSRYANWMRMIRPSEDPVWITNWQEISRPTYTNEQLLELVGRTPAMLD